MTDAPTPWSAGDAYDRIASQWERARTTATPALARLLDGLMARLPAGASVLDVGCGSGVPVARTLADRGFHVTGLDASAGLLALARRTVPSATLVHGDMRTVSLGGPFDAAVAWDSVFHLPAADHAAVFARLHDWLRPDAPLLLSLGGSAWQGSSEMFGVAFHYGGHAPEESLRLLAEAGLAVEHMEIDDPGSRGHLAVVAVRRA